MTTIRAFSPKLGPFFPIFEKGQGRPPPPPPLELRACNLCRSDHDVIIIPVSSDPLNLETVEMKEKS